MSQLSLSLNGVRAHWRPVACGKGHGRLAGWLALPLIRFRRPVRGGAGWKKGPWAIWGGGVPSEAGQIRGRGCRRLVYWGRKDNHGQDWLGGGSANQWGWWGPSGVEPSWGEAVGGWPAGHSVCHSNQSLGPSSVLVAGFLYIEI